MASVVHHIARRGVEFGMNCAEKMQNHRGNGDLNDALEKLAEKLKNPVAIFTFALTGVAFFLITAAIEYAIRIVAINLAIVEDTEPVGAIKLPLGKEDTAKIPYGEEYSDEDIDERVLTVSAVPITSSIRGTFRYISAIAGYRARFRGLSYGLFAIFCNSVFVLLFNVLFASFPLIGMGLSNVLAAVVCCNLRATWTHATIAMPSDKPFMQRFLSRCTARKLILPTIRLQCGLFLLQVATVGTTQFAHSMVNNHGFNWLSSQAYLLPVVTFFGITLFHVLPSQIALVRTEASLLPEDQSAIVPFDRTFGGRFNWEALTDRKARVFHGLSIRGAYKTFDKPVYMRVVKMLVKLFMIMAAVSTGFLCLFMAELSVFAGKDLRKVHAQVKIQQSNGML